jgi:methanogenic corrinoid protein MtbC1
MHAEILQNLQKSVREYDGEAAAMWARKALDAGVEPVEALDALTEVIREVGDGFGKGELWLPDLVGAADAMKRAVPILEAGIGKTGKQRESLGVVVVGTVFGDIHDIGKTMVATMLIAEGFVVHDLGVNVTAAKFVEAIKEYQPDILALSALLTTTAPELHKVIQMLKAEGLRDQVRIMVGGGALTAAFAQSIGADGYDPTAPGAAKLARSLIGK